MKSKDNDDFQLESGNAATKLDTSIAFLQIPTKIKDRVKSFIEEIADEEDMNRISSGDNFSPFQSNGCFFVISLDQIEQIHSLLRNALDPSEDDIDKMRANVQKALSALQG